MAWAIEASGLTKYYPGPQDLLGWASREKVATLALDGVDLAVKKGELFGLVGPNGAGKTTLIKTFCTLIAPTQGYAQVNGYDLSQESAIRASIGLVTSDERSFYWRLSARQNLEFFATLHHLSPAEINRRIDEVLEIVGLREVADKRFLTFSTGMRQRLSIARALLSRPETIFLDEPTKGLDPSGIQSLHKLIREDLTRHQGLTILLTSHWLQEVEKLCDRIAIMNQGRIQACGSMLELRKELDLSEPATLETIFTRLTRNPDPIKSRRSTVRQKTMLQPRTQANHIQVPVRSSTQAPGTPILSKLADQFRIAWAFLKRDVLEEASYRLSFLLQFLNIFFSVGLFYFIAQLLGEAAIPHLQPYGGDYFAFVLIGIAFAGYFGVGLSSFSSSLRQAQTTGTLEAMLTTPTSLSTIILSSSLWSYLLTTLRVLVYLLIGTIFLGVELRGSNYPGALLILMLTVIAFSSLGILAASFIMVLKRGDPVTWLFNATSSFLGGVYYPVTIFPGWLQFLAYLLPVTYALRAMRLALLQGATFQQLSRDILILALFSVVLLPVSLLTFRFAVKRAKVDGSLSHF
jgi:ABC-type multidrug transport system ATPase subunit/ABC-type multidrug transport system permease subunit